jgi:outer membrane translocation and assembly module TamA
MNQEDEVTTNERTLSEIEGFAEWWNRDDPNAHAFGANYQEARAEALAAWSARDEEIVALNEKYDLAMAGMEREMVRAMEAESTLAAKDAEIERLKGELANVTESWRLRAIAEKRADAEVQRLIEERERDRRIVAAHVKCDPKECTVLFGAVIAWGHNAALLSKNETTTKERG